jgi:uncharacterized protein YnzC (UPF0291/DUF896 family)
MDKKQKERKRNRAYFESIKTQVKEAIKEIKKRF